MQFHLDGFRPGDPAVAEPAAGAPPREMPAEVPAEVDVLVVGCGPAGLVLAAQLAAFAGIRTAIIDEKPGPLRVGQADGIACRTVEMFNAFGFAERVLRESYWVNETSFWKPDDADRARISRSGRIQDTEDGLSEFPHVILNQARVHDFLLERMRDAPTRLAPHYARRLDGLDVAGAGQGASHPVTATLRRLDPGHEGEVETVRARFAVGCDGARSGVRRALGLALRGDSANQAWGVMDVLAVTDFPDIRLKATVHSAREGSVLVIPREGGYLVRLYIELDKLGENERVAGRNIGVEQLIAAARRILHPYALEVREVAWWSVYEIGQRLSDRFDDLAGDEGDDGVDARVPRVFIAGDACHTHSPKAGQGMNVSMQDSFNLGWKLASVLLGRARPALLRSYSAERRAVARELIEFDRAFARMFSARPRDPDDPDDAGVDPAGFQDYFVRQGRFTAGTATRYQPSLVTGADTHQQLAHGFPVGMRFHSAPVIRLADARPMQLGHVVLADGRWRLFAFAAAGDDAFAGVRGLCDALFAGPDAPLRRHARPGEDADALIDLRAVLQRPHRAVSLSDAPAALLPRKGRLGLIDYEKLFCADPRDDLFDARGIDRARGCMVLVRPDQYVAHVLPLDAVEALSAFLGGVLLPAD